MRITAELSLYPLGSDDPIERITGFVRELREQPGIEMITNQMSTQLRGELDHVQRAVDTCMKAVMESGDRVVLVAKYLNADLPIESLPRL